MDGFLTLFGVIVGAVVVIYAPMLTARWKERNRVKQLLKALLIELKENEHISRTVIKKELPFSYLSSSINSASYEEAKANGVLADIPSTFLKNLIGTYEMASRFNDLLGRPQAINDIEEFLKIYKALPKKFKSTADLLRQYLENRKLVKKEDSESDGEQKTNESSNTTQDAIRKEYFLALAPAYIAGSYYLIQVTSKSTIGHLLWFSYTLPYGMKYMNIGLSVFLLLWAVFLCYLAFGKIPKSSKGALYNWVAGISGLAPIFYMYGWIQNLVEIITSGTSVWYYYLFYISGIIVIAALVIYPYSVLAKWFLRKIKSN